MTVNAAISLVFSFFWFLLIVKTIMRDNRDRSHLLFSALCLAMIVWTLCIGIAYSLEEMRRIELFLKLAYIGGFLFSPIILHFYLVISGTRIRNYYLALNYLPPVALMISNCYDFFIFSALIKNDGEWVGIINRGSVRMYIYIATLCVTFAISFLVLLRWNMRTKINKEKKQSLLILLFFTASYFTALVMTLILPFFDIHDYQYAGIMFFALYIVGLYFLVIRYRFLNMHTTISANEIIANINELVFILDRDYRITDLSKTAGEFFKSAARELRKLSYLDIIRDGQEIRNRLESISGNTLDNFTAMVHYDTGSGVIPTKTYFSGMRDKFNDNTGFFVVSTEIKEADRFREAFRITSREFQIVGLIVSGSTYKDISGQLAISEKTVERHVTNIYNKLGINNKIDLYRIAEEYNIKL